VIGKVSLGEKTCHGRLKLPEPLFPKINNLTNLCIQGIKINIFIPFKGFLFQTRRISGKFQQIMMNGVFLIWKLWLH